MTRMIGPTGSRRRRRFLLVPSLCIAALALFYVGSAQAVHDLAFQLDGDVSTFCFNPNPPPADCSIPNDWGANASNSSSTQASPNNNGVFDVKNTANGSARPDGTTCALAAGCQDVVPNPNLVPGTFSNASFQRDFESGPGCSLFSQSTTFCTGDDTTYATGSKDTLGIANGGWQCNHDNNVNSKIDIMNAYVATYINPANGHLIEYFGLEKNKNNGTNDVGVWFLKGDANCTAPSGHHNFTGGGHQDGDTLVVSEFTQGGGVSTIQVFAWAAATSGPLSGDGGCIDSHDNPNPAGGCDGKPIFQSTNQDCKGPVGSGDPVCATTNATGSPPQNGNVTTPWLTSDATLGVGHTVVPPDFYEGGIDITATFGQAGQNAPRCFTTAVPDTRSSATVTATLFDYVINKIGSCSATLTTKAGDTANGGTAPPTNIDGGSVNSGTDVATLNVKGTASWAGAVDFYLCGPLTPPAGTGSQCNKSTALLVTHKAVSGGATAVTVVSGSATLTKVGTYCWAAHFEPNAATKAAGVNGVDDKIDSGDNSANECFTVAPNTPSLATTAVDCTTHLASHSVTFGTALCDKGTLSNASTQPATNGIDTNFNSIICNGDADGPSDPAIPTGAIACTTAGSGNGAAPGGSIQFKLLGPNDCTTQAAGTPAANNPETVNVTAGNGDYFTSGFTTSKVGAFHWTASYTPASGDVNNNGTSHNTLCDDTAEDVTVTGTTSSASDQRWLPNDRITLTGDAALSGTLDVKLYKGTFSTDQAGNCVADNTAVLEYSSLNNSISGASPQTFNTTNNAFYVGSGPAVIGGVTVTYGDPGAYFWLIHYQDTNLTSPLDRCESSTVSITN